MGVEIVWEQCPLAGLRDNGRVREQWTRPSSRSTLRVVIWLCWMRGVKLIEWFAEGVGCEYFNRCVTEVGGDGILTYLFECSNSVSRS
jgi:hypothetical protein